MGERKMRIVDVARETGLNRNTVSSLYSERAQRIDFHTVEVLCDLFDCEISDLFERVKD